MVRKRVTINMDDVRKTKAELIEELVALRQQVAKLQARESAQRQTEEALHTAQKSAEILITCSLDMIISVDVHRKITEFNPAAEYLFGYRRAEVLGQPVDLLYEDPAYGLHIHTTTFREGAFFGEVMNRKKNGEVFCSYLSASMMRNVAGEMVGFMGISRDITDKKALEQQRGEFLAMLTHDIKKPLGAILACAEMVLETLEAHSLTEEEDLLERLRSNALTIDSLVTNYLDFSRIETGSLTLAKMPLAIEDILLRIWRQYEAEARRKHIRLELEHAAEPLAIKGDPLALERVFANLVHNALKFTPELGQVTVKAVRQGSTAVVTVADTGAGIASEDLPFLFEKYRRSAAARQREGTGLGLVIVKALVEAHGGRVEIESTLGQGTCVSVCLLLTSGA